MPIKIEIAKADNVHNLDEHKRHHQSMISRKSDVADRGTSSIVAT